MLISVRKNCSKTFIGEASCISSRIISHNTGFGANAQAVQGMQPVALWAYICGFDNDYNFRNYIYKEWVRKKSELRSDCPLQIAECGGEIIENLMRDHDDLASKLRFVCHFEEESE